MTHTRQIAQYPEEKLPVMVFSESLHYEAMFISIIKKHSTGKVLKLDGQGFLDDVKKLVKLIESDAFNRGLAKMDKAHGYFED